MNDGQRIYPVDILVVHHSMGPEFANASDLTVQDWFSSVGRGRGYAGVDHSYHEHPSRPGVETFSQAQFAGIADSSNKYNYRIVTLIKRPWDNVAWHAGNWGVNQQSVGLENCGDYTGKLLTEKQLMCIADWYRPKDIELKGTTAVFGHKEIQGASTACPSRIMEQRDKLVDMINNPAKWNLKLWPPAPKPVITTKTEVKTTPIPFEKQTAEDPTKTITETISIGVNGSRTITYTVTYTDGKETARVIKSDVTVPSVPEITVIGTYVPPIMPPVDTDLDKDTNQKVGLILTAINWLVDTFKKIFNIK